jgi:proteasome accessory factor A
MAIPKIVGTETEYGITVKNHASSDPISNSILIVNSYQGGQAVKIIWDYQEEAPFVDARGFRIDRKVDVPRAQENTTINKILDNGARFYVDHAHPEFSTPECANARDVVIYEKAGDRILYESLEHANQVLQANQQMIVYKNNTDHKGNSYGYHENYLLDRKVPFDMLHEHFATFLITRQIFTGAGKVGAENNTIPATYQVSQRADFFETEIGLDTMLKRPIINTRDEPHADKEKYRRLHVIAGDVNMSEFATYLKIGTTALMLSMIEDKFLHKDLKLQHPVTAMRAVSRDVRCRQPLLLENGKRYTALDIQYEYLNAARRYVGQHPELPLADDLLEKWEDVLNRLRHDPLSLHRELDWVIKHAMIAQYQEKHHCEWDDPRVAMLDLQYHDLRPRKGLYYLLERQGHVERIVSDDEIATAVTQPPTDTRAYFRGQCLQKYRSKVFGVSWGAISFDTDEATVKRVLMPEPTKGSQKYVHDLLENSETVEELLTNMLN